MRERERGRERERERCGERGDEKTGKIAWLGTIWCLTMVRHF